MFSYTIRLERGMCYGSCPVYNLTVLSDGIVIYEGIKFVEHEGVHIYEISDVQLSELLKAFSDADFFSLDPQYMHSNATDMPTVRLSFLSQGRSLEVEHYHGDFSAPKRLSALENKIDMIVDIDNLARSGDIVGKKRSPWRKRIWAL